MNLELIRQEKTRGFSFKDNKIKKELLATLPEISNIKYLLEDRISINALHVSAENLEKIHHIALALRPWRKGPFQVFDTFIDTEWQSFIKYNLLAPHVSLKDKIVGDIGCNNGYYLFRMLQDKPKKLVGFDPSILCNLQFDFINSFLKSEITFELLGVEHLPFYEHKFDLLFCLGVLYHRPNPINTLKELYAALLPQGELVLDTFMIDGDESYALTPAKTYSKIPNIYFIPTVRALQNWCERAKFSSFEVLAIKATDMHEQRKTDWILGESLENFLDPSDATKTIEGYPAPKRVYIKVRK
ncbi:MAG: tRNA 5-methoxyuridine(34)/uridine 5-oxyacetic acid(34) synthase CmoB [Sulfurospirillum sp.]|nr:tRNA 5-methoxyuridine(34)/uridine 5-oxyacetic acid(34) synthase CmoB [Sulfurospirillum sp.]